jgi:hypothetical protein
MKVMACQRDRQLGLYAYLGNRPASDVLITSRRSATLAA